MFSYYKSVGFVSDGNSCCLNYLGDKVFICSSIRDSFQIYRYDNLNVCFTSKKLPKGSQDVSHISVFGQETFVSSGANIYVYDRIDLGRIYNIGQFIVHQIIIGSLLLVYDDISRLTVINFKKRQIQTQFQLSPDCTAICHPDTYINKVVFGFANGSVELWNFNSQKLIYSFQCLAEYKGSSIHKIVQTPFCDVVAIGFNNGLIVFMNLKIDKVLFTCRHGNNSPVSSMAFQLDPRQVKSCVMITSSSSGTLYIWHIDLTLEEKLVNVPLVQLKGEIIAHSKKITTLEFLNGEPVLMTSSLDNSIKLWIFDSPDGMPRLLKYTSGHETYPNQMRFYTASPNLAGKSRVDHGDCEMFSCGLDGKLRFSSIIADSKGRPFSDKIISKNKKKLPIIEKFDFSELSDVPWGTIASVHKNCHAVHIWDGKNRSITDKVLSLSDHSTDHATAVAVTSCGNFCVIGYRSGAIYKFNLQSGLERGSFKAKLNDTSCNVIDIFVDRSNSVLVSCRSNNVVSFWDFRSHASLSEVVLPAKIVMMRGCRGNGFIAVADLFHNVYILNVYNRRIVRQFLDGHSRLISDIVFANKFIITSSLDSTIRVYDFASGRCVSWSSFDSAVMSMAVSPSYDFLCVGLYDQVGILTYANRSLYENLYLSDEPSFPTPINSVDIQRSKKNSASRQFQLLHQSPRHTDEGFISFSKLSRLFCTNLFHLETLRKRNELNVSKLKKTVAVPFFLANIGRVDPDLDQNTTIKMPTTHLMTSSNNSLLLHR